MKLFLLGFVLLATSSLAEEVKPIAFYPSFWDNKPSDRRPPASFFENYDRQVLEGRVVGGQIAK